MLPSVRAWRGVSCGVRAGRVDRMPCVCVSVGLSVSSHSRRQAEALLGRLCAGVRCFVSARGRCDITDGQ